MTRDYSDKAEKGSGVYCACEWAVKCTEVADTDNGTVSWYIADIKVSYHTSTTQSFENYVNREKETIIFVKNSSST